MEKKIWTAPVAEVEQFMANEYVAACGDKNKIYYFQCNAPEGTLYYYKKNDGLIDGKYTGTGSATQLGSFHPNLSVLHEADSTDPFYDGFIDYNRNKKHDADEGVIVWIENEGSFWGEDYHATKELNMDEWETAKS